MRILCLHGVGNGDRNIEWRVQWQRAIEAGLAQWGVTEPPTYHFTLYDDLFEEAPLDAPAVIEAFARLTTSGLFHGFVDIFRNRRGFGDTLRAVRWTAGMVAQWVAHDDLRARTRRRIGADIASFEPDLILAHSLGSLILYDTLCLDDEGSRELGTGRTVVTFGSQIGNRAVRQTFGGRIRELRQVRRWWHLYNRHDDVFTCPIELPTRDRFQQVDTHFDIEGFGDHDGASYLAHAQTALTVWHETASGRPRARKPAPRAEASRVVRARTGGEKAFRALLVGIADYPDPENVLEGPVNDVYLMSATLQQLGFPADSIRVVLDDRATCKGIRERLCWLLLDAKPGDTLFFFFAGHGAQIPAYGRDAEVDRLDECLVPYDFDWKSGDALTDDELATLYTQLPYETRFFAVLDCCHSGGMTRGRPGGVRGLTPPDDVRHRSIRWDPRAQAWKAREKLEKGERPELARRSDPERELWVGGSGAKRRIGRGTPLWMDDHRKYERTRDAYGHKGPFTPVLFEACKEEEFAYEYRHGNVNHGAFTYALCGELQRASYPRRRQLTFRQLLERVKVQVPELAAGPQTPQMICPDERWDEALPGLQRKGARK